MKLVTFQSPIFNTVQGEGSLLGVPSTFLRLYGCNESCAWCDTKDSWREGSLSEEVEVQEVVRRLRKNPLLPHLVVTGGNPMLQAAELDQLFASPTLNGHHVTIETNAHGEGTVHHFPSAKKNEVSILWSLSPKLATWDTETVAAFIVNGIDNKERTFGPKRSFQLKIVVRNEEDCDLAEDKIRETAVAVGNLRFFDYPIILQPEYGMMKRGAVDAAVKAATRLAYEFGNSFPVRVIPQVHKFLAVV